MRRLPDHFQETLKHVAQAQTITHMDSETPKNGEASALQTNDHFFCPECAYNLRGLPTRRCPECGYRLDDIGDTVSKIPWVHRKERGLLRAYWSTVWQVSFRHKRFCQELVRPVDYADAQRFRCMTIAHAFAAALIAVCSIILLLPQPSSRELFVHGLVTGWPICVLLVLYVLFLIAATGLPSYFFHPKAIPVELQNRAIAMSYYTCAVLAWLPLPAVLFAVGFGVRPHHLEIGEFLLTCGFLIPLGQFALWWLDLLHVASRVMPQLRRRVITIAVAVPMLWSAAAAFTFVFLPVIIVYTYLAFTSFD